MTTKTSPVATYDPALLNYTAINAPLHPTIASALHRLAPTPEPTGGMATLLGIPVFTPLDPAQRAQIRAARYPQPKVHTLTVLNDRHATMDGLTRLMADASKPYTRIRMSAANHYKLWHVSCTTPDLHCLMPTFFMFRGVTIVPFTEQELHEKRNPKPRAKKRTR